MPLPERFAERLCFKIMRRTYSIWRAYTELFVPPYDGWVEWNSGLGPAIHVLYGLARALRPNVIVEIGTARGKSACAMALACRQNGGGKVFAIDPWERNDWTDAENTGDDMAFVAARLNDYGLTEHCELVRATSDQAAENWTRPIDLLFIDGDHSYQGVRRDFELFRPWLSPQGVVAFHDTLWEYARDDKWYRDDNGVPRYMQELAAQGYPVVNVAPLPGLALAYHVPKGFDFLNGRRLGQ